MAELWQRLKQRKLVQWAVAYIAAAFALLQGIDIIAQQFGWAVGLQRGITLALVLGFFITLLLAWYHGERGEQKVSGVELLILAAVLAVGGGLLWRYAGESRSVSRSTTNAAVPSTHSAPEPDSDPASSIPAKSIAVLPLANESGDKDQQYFSDGLSEDLITALSQFDGLKVISRNSAFQFRDSKQDSRTIGEKLGVAHLLEGSVRREGDTVRINASLVTAADGSTSWSQHYDRPYKDLFKLQDEITAAVANALKAKLLPGTSTAIQSDRPPSGDLAAYNAYQQGRFYTARGTADDTRKAIDAFKLAVQIAPDYAQAWASLSQSWTWLASHYLGGAGAQQAYAQASHAAGRALTLAPELGEAHLARGILLINRDLDWHGAQAEYRRAVLLAPDNSSAKIEFATLLASLGQPERAVTLIKEALTTDPLSVAGYFRLSMFLTALGRLDEADAAAAKVRALQPDAQYLHVHLTILAIMRGDAATALAAAQGEPEDQWREVALALARQIGPDRAAADAALKTLIDHWSSSSAFQIAEVYAVRNDADNTFDWLDRAWASRDPGIAVLRPDPLIGRFAHDPRYAAFCRKVGLPAPADAAVNTKAAKQ